MLKARVVGAGGYGGAGIIDLLLSHPETEIVDVVDVQNVGMSIGDKFPHLKPFCNLKIRSPEEVSWKRGEIDVLFTATPDGVGMEYAKPCLESGAKMVDFSGDFRFDNEHAYAEYSSRIGRFRDHSAEELLPQSVYGLAELHRKELADASLVGNPGCFAVSVILGLSPAVQAGLVDPKTLICDAKTGVSGAGITARPTFHYPSRYENMNAYKVACHQHCMETERELGRLAGESVHVTLTTQVLPLARGIMSTLYGRLTDDKMTVDDIVKTYEEFYRDAPFVRVVGPGGSASNNDVRGSNFCVLWVNMDPRTRQMLVISHIDNLMKGQAGSAVQNMNIMFGLDETAGLMRPPFFP